MLSGTPGIAADLTAARATANLDAGNGKHVGKVRATGGISKAAPKPKRHKISTYSLPNASARHDDAARGNNVRSAKPPNSVVAGSPSPLSAKNGFHEGSIARLRVEPTGDDGVTLDCRKGPFSQIRRTLTACYMQQLDKSWKAQTYVSKGSADSRPGWGGGIALGYAY